MQNLFTSMNEFQFITWELSRARQQSHMKFSDDLKTISYHKDSVITDNQASIDNNTTLKTINEKILEIIEHINFLKVKLEVVADEELLSYERNKQKFKNIIQYVSERIHRVVSGLQNLEKAYLNVSENQLRNSYFESIFSTRHLYSILEMELEEIEPAIEKITEPLKDKVDLLVTSHLFPALTGQISEEVANNTPPLENKIFASCEKNYNTATHFAILGYVDTALRGAYSHHYNATSMCIPHSMDIATQATLGYKIKLDIENRLDECGEINLLQKLDSLGEENDQAIMQKFIKKPESFIKTCNSQELAVLYRNMEKELKLNEELLNPYSILNFDHLSSCLCFTSDEESVPQAINYIEIIKNRIKKDFSKIDFDSEDYEFANLIKFAIKSQAKSRKYEIAETMRVREEYVGKTKFIKLRSSP